MYLKLFIELYYYFSISERLWRAPELLNDPGSPPTKEGDIYSVGIVMQEIVLRSGPFEKEKSHMEVSGKSLRSQLPRRFPDISIFLARGKILFCL